MFWTWISMHIVFVHRGKHKNGEKKGHKDVVYYAKHNDVTLFTWQYKKIERRKKKKRGGGGIVYYPKHNDVTLFTWQYKKIERKKKCVCVGWGGVGGGRLCTMQNTSDIQLLIW